MSVDARIERLSADLLEFQENLGSYVGDVVRDFEDVLLGLQKLQLFEGKDSDGNDITPSYLEDRYFKSPDDAHRYSAWKAKLGNPGKNKNPNTPDLYIPFGSHHFHDDIVIDVTDETITFKGGTRYAEEIISKYGLEKFGLRKEVWDKFVRKYLIDKIKEKLYYICSIRT